MTRTRSRYEYDETLTYTWQPVDVNGVPRGAPYYSYPRNFKRQTVVDVVTPDYFEKRAKGEFLPINATTITTHTQTQVGGSGSIMRKVPASAPQVTGETGTLFYLTKPSLPAVTIDAATVDNVVIKALASAKQADFDVLTFIGEFGDTVRLFRELNGRITGLSLRLVARAKRIVNRKNYRSYRQELARWRSLKQRGFDVPKPQRRRATHTEYVTEFTRLWLMARYGLRPLFYDFMAISSLLNEKRANSLARKSATLSRPLNATATATETYSTVAYDHVVTRTGEQRYRAVVYYKDNQSRIGSNPVITAYELTRMSFVFDWLIDVGSWLQAMSPREGYTELGVSVGVVSEYNDVTVSTPKEGSGHTHNVAQPVCSMTENIQKYERLKYTGIPLPSINVNLNPFKVMDLVALVVTNRSRIFRAFGL